jgi:hypothetical protein
VTSVRSYRDLVVWQKAMELAALCYTKTREQTGSYIHSLRVAQGSLKELETHVLLAQTVELMEKADAEGILEASEQVGKLLRSLIRALQDKAAAQ